MTMKVKHTANEYERLRDERIAHNQKIMKNMLGATLKTIHKTTNNHFVAGCAPHPDISLVDGIEFVTPTKKHTHKRKNNVANAQTPPSRTSGRLRGVKAPDMFAPETPPQQTNEPEKQEETNTGSPASIRGTRHRSLDELVRRQRGEVVAPFTCRYSGVTVWRLGEIARGDFQHRYWSSAGCLYHHAYPIGYVATKREWDRTFVCTIAKGDFGPVFTVSELDASCASLGVDIAALSEQGKAGASSSKRKTLSFRVSFAGPSPTKPWTSHCIARRTGRRISGPLYYGFSDPITMLAIYALYNDDERKAALAGGRATTSEPSALERVTRELSETLPGVGENVAIAIARTSALGMKINGVDDMRKLALEDETRLTTFLTTNDEIPEATRRWPKWKGVHVPRLLSYLKGESSEEKTWKTGDPPRKKKTRTMRDVDL